jgi:hypothetical protein
LRLNPKPRGQLQLTKASIEEFTMSDETKSTTDGPGDMMRMWMDMASRATEACQTWAGAAGASAAPDMFRQNRSNVFKMWSDYWEQFLRSASFLEAQKQSMSGGMEFQKQSREYLAWLHHELQMPSSQDIDQLMIGMRRLKEDLREQFDEIGGRLDNLAAQVNALAARLNASEQKAPEQKAPAWNAPAPADRITENQTA